MHPNITPNASFTDRTFHKLFWAIFAILIPELFHVTPGSDDDLIGVEGAYFVLMRGFIAPRGYFKDYTTTLTADWFKWAIQERGKTGRVLSRGSFNKQDIRDKGKGNNIAKLVVCVQAGWVVVQALGRVADGLTVTLLELHVSIQVLIAVVLYMLWWSKLLDVDQPIELPELAAYTSNEETTVFPLPGDNIDIEMKPTAIHSERMAPEEYLFVVAETPVENPFAETAMENPFIETPPGPSVPPAPPGCFLTEKKRTGAAYILCKVIFDCATGLLASPGQRQLKLGLPAVLIFVYGGLHITAWKAHFPTPEEMWMWRVTCLGMLFAGVVLLLPFRTLGKQCKRTILHLWTLRLRSGNDIGNFKREISKVFMDLRTEVTGNIWERLKFDFSMFSLVIYLFAMVFLTTESIISLRRPPLDAYHTPIWTAFWPHV
ncbi:hypothetical protein BDD12DRAFT_825123 [Trichophaea hybrida]|nr:hypothetical protein BDD12DRAFT_825123 [Trichophaea hybrida]